MRRSPRLRIVFALLFGILCSAPLASGDVGELQDRLRADLDRRIEAQSRVFLGGLLGELAEANLSLPAGWRPLATAPNTGPACAPGRAPGLECLSPPLRRPEL